MSKKLKGILTPILIVVMSIVIGIGSTLFVDLSSSGGWAALEALLIVFMLTGLILVILIIVGAVLYFKNRSEFGLGILIGMGSLVGLSLLARVIIGVYNFIIL